MSLPPDSLAEMRQWLAAARCGSRESLGQLLESYRNYLLLIANSELNADLRAKGGASDLVQETFLKAQKEFGSFQGSSVPQLRGWLRSILVNNLMNFRRDFSTTEKRQVSREVSLEAIESQDAPLRCKDRLFADTPTPSRQAIQNEESLAVEIALERLPHDYRQVILWRNRDKRSFAEIGQSLNRSSDAVRMIWFRALERLQRELEPNT